MPPGRILFHKLFLWVLTGVSYSAKKINRMTGNCKRFMAYDIIDKLKEQRNEIILDQLSKAVNASERKRGKLHEVF